MKGWEKDVLTAATCYEKQAGPISPNSALARLPEITASSLKGINTGTMVYLNYYFKFKCKAYFSVKWF